jgi:AcrR family transcriptional regulator/DNA-binding MarR family transcriptional regulator
MARASQPVTARRTVAARRAGAERDTRRRGRVADRCADLASTQNGAGLQEQVSHIQRARLLAGAVAAIEEHGYTRATVAHITARARVSRRTFYELFENRDACMAALIEDVVSLVEAEIAAAGLERLSWEEQMRGGLALILAFLDREPALARVCVVQALRGGPVVLTFREEVLASIAAAVDRGRAQGKAAAECSPLIAEGLVGAIVGIVHGRLARRGHEPLIGLLGELTGLVVLPYLGSAAARREQRRPLPSAPPRKASPVLARLHGDPLVGLPMRLTYRTTRVLECVAEHPGVSNRTIAKYAGVSDQGQISKLLARLERLELVRNTSGGHAKGEPNAWSLTALGEQIAQRLRIESRKETA